MPPVVAEGKEILCTIQIAQIRPAVCFILIVCFLNLITGIEINNKYLCSQNDFIPNKV